MTTTPETADRPYSYVDKTTGDRRAFTPKSDEAMVTLRPEVSTDDLNDVVRETPVLSVSEGYNVEQGYAAVYLDPGADADAAADSVTARPEVTALLPVMVDEHGASRYFVPGELTVQFRSDVPAEQAEQAIADLGSEIVQRQRTPGYYTVRIPGGRDLFAAIDEFTARDDVAFAEPSEVSFNSALVHVPTDADFGLLWGLRNTGQTVNGAAGLAGADIRATDAWDVTRGHPDVVVTVIDTGADLDHPDLAANLLARGNEDWDFANGPDQVPDDEDGHGSHVAGTAAGVENVGGVLGVAPGCRIMPLRVDLTTGQNQNRADAINYVADQSLQHGDRRYVINCSWRMNGDHAGVRTAIQNAVRDNVVVVFAAGNANSNTDITPQFPGVYPEVISVAALDQQDARAVFSNFGTNVDVAAPGVNIWSALPNDVHGFLDGTSMAAPHVAGVAALIWSRNRHLTNGQVRSILEETAVSVDAANPGFAGMLGRGRVSALGAVTTPHLFPGLFDHSVRGDLTGDGRADIVGFGDAGVWVVAQQRRRHLRAAPARRRQLRATTPAAGGSRSTRASSPTSPATAAPTSSASATPASGSRSTTATAPSASPSSCVDNFAYDAGGWRVEQAPALPRRPHRRRPRRHRRVRRRRRLGLAEPRRRHLRRAATGRRQLRLRRRRLARREAPALPRRPHRRRPRRHRRLRRRRRLGLAATTATAPSASPSWSSTTSPTTPAAGASRSTRASWPTSPATAAPTSSASATPGCGSR